MAEIVIDERARTRDTPMFFGFKWTEFDAFCLLIKLPI